MFLIRERLLKIVNSVTSFTVFTTIFTIFGEESDNFTFVPKELFENEKS